MKNIKYLIIATAVFIALVLSYLTCIPSGQANLGWVLYNEGLHEQAIYWFRKGAEQENAKAENGLGWAYQNDIDDLHAIKLAANWFRKAAEHGNINAQENLKQRVIQEYLLDEQAQQQSQQKQRENEERYERDRPIREAKENNIRICKALRTTCNTNCDSLLYTNGEDSVNSCKRRCDNINCGEYVYE